MEKLQAEGLPVVRLREIVAELKGAPEPLNVFDTAKIAERIVARTMRAADVGVLSTAL